MKQPAKSGLFGTKALMAALLRQPPKPHDEMKAVKAKPTAKKKARKAKKKA
jgi:hypothetical protein